MSHEDKVFAIMSEVKHWQADFEDVLNEVEKIASKHRIQSADLLSQKQVERISRDAYIIAKCCWLQFKNLPVL